MLSLPVPDASAGPGGDGSRGRPFGTLAAAAAAAAGPAGAGAHVTLLLRGGTYRLAEALQLGPGHSNLTIQNYGGEAVSISGAMPVNVTSKHAWSLANASTNTWKLDIAGQAGQLFPNYGLRWAGRRAILAKFPNGDPALSAVHIDSGSIPYGPGTYLPGSGRSEQIPAYFSRQHAPVNTTTEFWARPGVAPTWAGPEILRKNQPNGDNKGWRPPCVASLGPRRCWHDPGPPSVALADGGSTLDRLSGEGSVPFACKKF